jgi:hypothetical protein
MNGDELPKQLKNYEWVKKPMITLRGFWMIEA